MMMPPHGRDRTRLCWTGETLRSLRSLRVTAREDGDGRRSTAVTAGKQGFLPCAGKARTLVAALLLALAGQVAAQAAVEVAAAVEPAQVTVGDVFELRVSVRAPEGTTLGEVGPQKKLAPARLRGTRVDRADDAQVRVLSLALYEVGERTFEGLQVSYRLPGAAKDETATVPPCKVTVVSVVPANATDILDIRPPVPPGATVPRWLLLAAAALVVALALGLLVAALVKRLRRRERPAKATPEVVLEAHGVALRDLDALADDLRLGRVELAEGRARLSLIVRRLLEARLDLPATRMTTDSLARALRRRAEEGGATAGLVQVLYRDDLARFSGAEDRSEAALGDVGQASVWVRELAASLEPLKVEPELEVEAVVEEDGLEGLPPIVSGVGSGAALGDARRGTAAAPETNDEGQGEAQP